MKSEAVALLKTTSGNSLIEAAILLPLLLLMLVGAVDFGRGYYAAIEVSSAAEAGALYGIQNPTDTGGMVKAVELDAADTPGITSIATYGCECSDGTSIVVSCGTAPTCTFNVINFVEVDTALSYTPILPYPGIPSSIQLSGKSRMRAAH